MALGVRLPACNRAGMDEAAIKLTAEGLQAAFEALNELARDLPMRRQERVETVRNAS